MAVDTLVLGIGNVLLGDEGAGVRLLEYLRAQAPLLPGVTYLDGGTLSIHLAGWIEAADHLLVIDAAELGAAPGTVRVFENGEMDPWMVRHGRSVHEVSLWDLLAIGRLTGILPTRRALVAIQPRTIAWGCELSLPVAQAIPAASRQVLEILKRWRLERPASNAAFMTDDHWVCADN